MPSTSNNFPRTFTQTHSFKKTPYSSVVKSGPQPGENDDISNEKILEIYFEALDALQKCKNKYDKMRVLGMMLNHVI